MMELTETHLPLPPSAEIKTHAPHHRALSLSLGLVALTGLELTMTDPRAAVPRCFHHQKNQMVEKTGTVLTTAAHALDV